MSVGTIIREYRKMAHLTQAELGERVFKSAQVISNWERGYTTGITAEDMKNLSNVLNIPPARLLEKETGNEPEGTKKGYYLDAETAEIANALKEGDGMLRVMFDTVRNLPPEKMREAANYVEYLKAKQHPEEE